MSFQLQNALEKIGRKIEKLMVAMVDMAGEAMRQKHDGSNSCMCNEFGDELNSSSSHGVGLLVIMCQKL